MDIEYYGANCFCITAKKTRLVFDDNLSDLGLKTITKPGDIVLFSSVHDKPSVETKLIIDQPGEYEVSGVSIQAIAVRDYAEETNQESATIFKVIADDIRIVVLGHIYHELSDAQLEAIGTVDVLITPVGGGSTLDPLGALKIIKKIEPKLVIPSHYADKAVKYAVPQQTLEEAIKGLTMEPRERVSKLRLKPSDLMIEGTQLAILDRQ